MTSRLVISQHDQLGGLGADDHVQYLKIDGTRAMSGDLDMGDNNIKNVGDIYGGDVITDSLNLFPNDQSPPVDFATDGLINANGRFLFLGFSDMSTGSGVGSPNFQLMRHDETCDCSGQSGIIPQGFWNTPVFQFNTAQAFGGASVFQDGATWTETAAISGSHGYFTLGSFLAGLRYSMGHAGTGKPPTELFGYSSQPGADAGTGTLTIAEVNAVQTNAVFGLKAFLGLEEFRNGVVVTTYRHFAANSNIANGLLLHGGSTITTEIGLDLRNLNHGATKITVQSDQATAYMDHAGNIRIPTDSKGLFLGGGLDTSLVYTGAVCYLDCGLVAPSDFVLDCGTDKTLVLIDTVWEDLRVSLHAGKPGITRPPTFVQFMDDGAGSVGVNAWSFADQAIAANEEELSFSVQLPHGYKEGTDIEAHLHWSPAVSGGANEFVKWGLEYTWANVDGTFGNTTIIASDASSAATATTSGDTTLTADKQYFTIIGVISGTGKTVSSMLVCRLFRNSSHADDDLAQAAFAFEFDFHFEIDTMGSRQILAK